MISNYSPYINFQTSEHLWADRLSIINTNFLSLYFFFIASIKLKKYSANISFLDPEPSINLRNSTEVVEIVAIHVKFFDKN